MGFVWKMRTPAHRCKININKMLGPPRFIVHLPQVSCDFEIEKALHSHKYKRKYRHNGEWIYIYEVDGEHHHTTWNHVEHGHHLAPKELRRDGQALDGAHSVTGRKGDDIPENAEDDSFSLPLPPNLLPGKANVALLRDKMDNPKREVLFLPLSEVRGSENFLGEGASGVVYREKGNPDVAVKTFKNQSLKYARKSMASECEISIALGDPSVGIAPEVIACRFSKEGSALASEYCESTLDDFEGDERKPLLLDFIAKLESMHKLGYAHGDLKDPNIFIHKEKGLFIGDFGNSAKNHTRAYFESIEPTGYMSSICKELSMGEAHSRAISAAQAELEKTVPGERTAKEYKKSVVVFYQELKKSMPSRAKKDTANDDPK